MRRVGWAASAFVVVLASSSAHAQTQEAVAQTRFAKGRELFIAQQYAPALVEFRAATELYESPNTRLYIARCERELGHLAAAYTEFERAASEAADRSPGDPRYTSTHDVAKQEATSLEPKLAHVTVLAPTGLPDGVTITMNGATLGPAGLGVSAPIDPGPVEVIAKAPGYVATRKTAHAAAGESIEVKIQLDKEPSSTSTTVGNGTGTSTTVGTGRSTGTGDTGPETPPDQGPRSSHGIRNAGFVVGGIGIAGMGVFGAFAGLAQNRFDSLKNQCGGPCNASFNSQIEEGQTFQTIANVALAAGGAALVTGAIMIVAGISTGHASTPPVTASVSPLVGGGWIAGIGRAF